MKKYFTFIGPIAAGKGTQAKIIANKYGLLHLSTGQIFRDAISSGSELGQKVKIKVAGVSLTERRAEFMLVQE